MVASILEDDVITLFTTILVVGQWLTRPQYYLKNLDTPQLVNEFLHSQQSE